MLVTDCDICGTHMRVQLAHRKLDSNKSQHTIVPLSPVAAHNSNTLLSKNVLQSCSISYMIHGDMFYFIMLQLTVPAKTEYSRPRYVSTCTNQSEKHSKLIVLRFGCFLIVVYTRSWDSFHWNKASGHAFHSCIVTAPW